MDFIVYGAFPSDFASQEGRLESRKYGNLILSLANNIHLIDSKTIN